MTIFDEIRSYLDKTGISAAEMGRAMSRGGGFITKLLTEQMSMTPDRASMIRQFIFDNPDYEADAFQPAARSRSGSGVDVAGNPDLWVKDAQVGSAMLLAALLKHYQARAAA